jgi:hypothetical protein
MILTCADDGELAEHLHWSSWTKTQATATGTVVWRVCSALCADSRRWDTTSANYTLTDPVRVRGKGFLFTRLELRVTGSTPRGFMRDLAFDEAPSAAPAPVQKPQPVRHRAALPLSAPSGTLGYGAIEGYWIYAKGPDGSAGSYTDAQVAAAITGAEAFFEPGVIQPDVDYCDPGSDRAGWGLWQITCGNDTPAEYGSDFQLLDPWNNAEAAVWKCGQDVAAGDNCFDPWSTYTSGAYTQYLQHTTPDMGISDPGEYVQINATPPGTPSSPPPDPGSTYGPPMPNTGPDQPSGPAVWNAANGHLEVYAQDSGTNDLGEDYWVSGSASGWSGWGVPQGSATIASVPDAIYDPIDGNLEVYATGTDGDMQESWWNPSSGDWSHGSMDGQITGSPNAVYNPASGDLEVYAIGAGSNYPGQLVEDYWNGSGWSGWKPLGGDLTASPCAVYDPLSNHLEVYARSTSGDLWEAWWIPGGTGWQTQDLTAATTDSGPISGSPSAVYDPAGGNLEVYATAASTNAGQLEEYYWNSASGWRSQYLGGDITDGPSAVYDPIDSALEVYAQGHTSGGSGGPLDEDYWKSGVGWSDWATNPVPGSSLDSRPYALYNATSGHLEVYALTPGTGSNPDTLWEGWWDGSSWNNQNLGGALTRL